MSAGLGLSDSALFRDQAYIDGAWVDADSGATYEVTNPATGAVIGTAPRMGAAEARRAIEAANAAYPAWRGLLAKERSVILRRFAELMMGRAWRVGEALEAGIVALNTGFISTEVAPFGGMKKSGIGREGSKYGVDDWLELKYFTVAGI